MRQLLESLGTCLLLHVCCRRTVFCKALEERVLTVSGQRIVAGRGDAHRAVQRGMRGRANGEEAPVGGGDGRAVPSLSEMLVIHTSNRCLCPGPGIVTQL